MLGAYAIEEWRRAPVDLEPGDVLVLFTDGVFDAVGAVERFGEARLERTLPARPTRRMRWRASTPR